MSLDNGKEWTYESLTNRYVGEAGHQTNVISRTGVSGLLLHKPITPHIQYRGGYTKQDLMAGVAGMACSAHR
jgi:hypothetical protein